MSNITLIIKPYKNPYYGTEQFAVFNEVEYNTWNKYSPEISPIAVFFSESDANMFVKTIRGNINRLNAIQANQNRIIADDKKEYIANYIKRKRREVH